MAWLAFFGFVNVYILRVNLSVALVAMVADNGTDQRGGNECPVAIGNTSTMQVC